MRQIKVFYGRLRLRYGDNAATAVIILLNVAVWLCVRIGSLIAGGPGIGYWFEMPSSGAALVRMPWTPLTYMVTHLSFWHLLFNMLWLWWFGDIIMTRLRPSRLVWLYIGGGLAGALCYFLFYLVVPGYALLCGASGSVLAVMTAAAVRDPDRGVRLFLLGNVRLKWIVLVIVALSFLGLGGGNAGGESAHIGGALFGAAYGFALRRGYDFIGRFVNLFGRRRAAASPRPDTRRVRRVFDARLADRRRLDELLDKIRVSGYDALTSRERAELQAISKRLNGADNN